MSFCVQCGIKLLGPFCGNCGEQAATTDVTRNHPESSSTPNTAETVAKANVVEEPHSETASSSPELAVTSATTKAGKTLSFSERSAR